jgi:hypothetical protein
MKRRCSLLFPRLEKWDQNSDELTGKIINMRAYGAHKFCGTAEIRKLSEECRRQLEAVDSLNTFPFLGVQEK